MSHLLDTGISDAESEAWGSETEDCSLTSCSSSSSLVASAPKPEKNLEGSSSLETGWTDSKHSSYLDFMEANFVQNMFARCYCMEDVCGGTAYHHHHQQHDSYTPSEETDYYTAESWPQVQTLECEMFDCGEWTAVKAKAAAGIPKGLLTNPWFKHFRRRTAPSVSIKTDTEMVKEEGQLQAIPFLVINSVGHHDATSDSLSGSEKEPDAVAPTASRMIVQLKATETKDFLPNDSINDPLDENASKSKRRALWLISKELRRTRQRTDD